MARTKERWVAYYAGGTFQDGRTVVIPVRLSNQPDRVVELRVPASSVERFLKGIVVAAETDAAEMIEQAIEEDIESSGGAEEEEAEEEPAIAAETRRAVPVRSLGSYIDEYRRNAGRHALSRT